MKVTIYSTPTCPYCLLAKRYFEGRNIPFVNFDVSIDPSKADEMVKLSGQMGVPVIKIDDKIIVGFDEKEVEQALNS